MSISFNGVFFVFKSVVTKMAGRERESGDKRKKRGKK
jgi:hypothetical protein